MAGSERVACPMCGAGLRADHAKMNVRVHSCPESHGVLLDPANLAVLVDEGTSERLRADLESGEAAGRACPACTGELRRFRLGAVDADGCASCGALWFGTENLRSHVLGVRRRAFGENSLAARADVHGTGTSVLSAEIVAGLLTDYALGFDESPNVV